VKGNKCVVRLLNRSEIPIVKVVLSIICSFAFAWAQIAVCAQVPLASATKADCGCGGMMACCKAQPAQIPQPLNTNPASAGNQNQLSVPSQNIVAWILPDAVLPGYHEFASALFTSRGTALYARDCALLI
jgi:hypothetical protein